MTFFQVFQNRMPRWSMDIYVVFILISSLIYLKIKRKKLKLTTSQWIIGSLLHFYIFNVIVTTLLMRTQNEKFQYDLRPFSLLWLVHYNGYGLVFYEIILNLLMLLPVGFLLPWLLKIKHRFIVSAFCTLGLTITIEILQFVTRVGVLQIDDIIANSIGGFFGAFSAWVIWKISSKNKSHNLQKINKNY